MSEHEIKIHLNKLQNGVDILIKSISGDDLGNVGIAKRLTGVEECLEYHQPTLLAMSERNKEMKKLKWTLIGCSVTSVVMLIGTILVHYFK